MKFRLMIAVLAVAFFACKSNQYSKSPKGYEYQVFSAGKSPKLKEGDVISGMQRTYILHTNGKDSFIGPQEIEHFALKKADQFAPVTYRAISDGLFMIGKGDSVSIIIPTD